MYILYNLINNMYGKSSDVIGEGTYGCVHSPSLTCKNAPHISYNKKVSKILRKKDANIELDEYKKLKNADGSNEFYLGTPDKCDLDTNNVLNMKSIEKCKIGNDVLRKIDQYNLIIMKDGGINLKEYTENMRTWSVSEESKENCEVFLLETLRLFKGLKIFESNGLIHHDVKPQNIVYNEKTNRLNYIDFGLMVSRNKVIKQASSGNYGFALFHWSYPWELEFINRLAYKSVFENPEKQEIHVNNVKNEIEKKKGNYYEHSSNFFYFVMDKNSSTMQYQSDCGEYILGYERTIKRNIDEMKYKKFLESSVRTIDIFGLGLTLHYWLHAAKKHLSQSLISDLTGLYSKMIEPELKYRPFINELLIEMEAILNKNGIIEKYNKKIVDHLVIDNDVQTPTPIVIEPERQMFDKITKPDEKLINATPTPCSEGKKRNENGNCVRIKKKALHKLLLPCPPGKIRNPKTRRCVKKCKPEQVRNEKFKCIKNKTKKL
jgi:serine/threonine protein kinase